MTAVCQGAQKLPRTSFDIIVYAAQKFDKFCMHRSFNSCVLRRHGKMNNAKKVILCNMHYAVKQFAYKNRAASFLTALFCYCILNLKINNHGGETRL